MDARLSLWLGIVFLVLGVLNALLAAWLWRFPMVPDPGGPDPNGRSTAPRSWTLVHRLVGYAFALIYLVLMARMVPRLWQFVEGWSTSTIVHAGLGVLIVPLLFTKVAIIRRFQRFGKKLPLFGGAIAALGVLTVALVAPSASRITSPAPATEGTSREILEAGRAAVAQNCFQCHGAGFILSEADDDWTDIIEDMQGEARETPHARPISDSDVPAMAAYLAAVTSSGSDDIRDDESSVRGRGRGRGRGGRNDD